MGTYLPPPPPHPSPNKHNPLIFSVPPGTEKLNNSSQASKEHLYFQYVGHDMFNNSTYSDFRTALVPLFKKHSNFSYKVTSNLFAKTKA